MAVDPDGAGTRTLSIKHRSLAMSVEKCEVDYDSALLVMPEETYSYNLQ